MIIHNVITIASDNYFYHYNHYIIIIIVITFTVIIIIIIKSINDQLSSYRATRRCSPNTSHCRATWRTKPNLQFEQEEESLEMSIEEGQVSEASTRLLVAPLPSDRLLPLEAGVKRIGLDLRPLREVVRGPIALRSWKFRALKLIKNDSSELVISSCCCW